MPKIAEMVLKELTITVSEVSIKNMLEELDIKTYEQENPRTNWRLLLSEHKEAADIKIAELTELVNHIEARANRYIDMLKGNTEAVTSLIDKCNRLESLIKAVSSDLEKFKAEFGIKRLDNAVQQAVAKR